MLSTARTLLHLGAARIADQRHRRPLAPATADATTWLAQLQTQGFVVVPNFYSAAQCTKLRQEVDRLLADFPATTFRLPDDDRIHGAERVSELINGYHRDERLQHLAELFHQAPITNLFTLANRVRPEPGGLGSGGGWHRDSVHADQFKTLLYLTDVPEPGAGAYQYVANTHTEAALVELVRSGQVGFNQNRLTDTEVQAIVARSQGRFPLHTITGAAGTLVITNTRGLHRGHPTEQGIRYALTNYFFARHHLSAKSETRFRSLFVDREVQGA